MDLYGIDLGLDLDTVSGEGYSVEDILAEFHSDSGAELPAIDRQEAETAESVEEKREREPARRGEARRRVADRERRRRDERPKRPAAKPRREEAEETAEELFEEPAEAPVAFEPEPEIAPAPAEAPAYEPEVESAAAPSWSFSERRSSLPSEEEIRAFMAEYGVEDILDAPEEPEEAPRYPGEPEFDERFHVDSKRRRGSGVRYAGRHVDQSADEKYTPHAPSEYVSSYAPDETEDVEEDEETPDEAPRLGFLGRMRETLSRERQEAREKELARREAARKLNFPSTQELVLPEEQAQTEQTAEPEPDVDEILRESGREHAWYTGAPLTPPEPPAVEEESAEAGPKPAAAADDADREERAHRITVRPEKKKRAQDEPEDELKPAWSRSAASRKEYAVVFPDTSASPAVYAMEEDADGAETEPPEDNEGDALKEPDFFPASFKEYIFSLLTSFLYRLRGGAKGTMTMNEEEEDLGEEVTPSFASRYYGSHIRSMRLRLRCSLILLAVMAWISFGLPVTGRLNDTAVASFMCLALQLGVMLLCLDVFTGGVLNGVRGNPGLDTMAALACFVTSVDAVFSGLDGFSAVHMPLCLLSSCSLVGVLISSLFSCRALRKTLRVPAIARRSFTVTGETNIKNGDVTLLKSVRPTKGFVRRTEEAAPDETMFRKLCLPALLLVLLMALVTAAVKRNVRDFFYILSVLLCPAVPFAGLLSFAMPFFTGSMRLFPSGAAVAGWSGVSDIGQSRNLIVTDRDLFPDGSVEIDTVRIFADADPVTIISYAGSMLTACGSSVSSCFGELMKKNGGRMRQIENFEYLPGGGMRGVIDSRVILCGSTDLMQLMNVRIPYRLVNRTSVLLAVDGLLYGIFNMRYDPQPAVRRALIGLMRSGRHPIFAIRDFNVTPSMLHDSFDVATDGYDFPPYVERFAMSEGTPSRDSQVAAVVCRDGLGPLSDTADIGRSIYVAARANLIITVLGMIAGILTAFVQLLRLGGVGIPFLFFFMLLWAAPVFLVGRILRLER